MRIILPLLFAISISFNSFSQSSAKLSFNLYRIINESKNTSAVINVLAEGDISSMKSFLSQNGGTIKYSAGNIASIIIPINKLNDFSSQKFVSKIEGDFKRMTTMNDTMRMKNNVNEVHQGLPPLPQAYDGSGVVLGFIDSGIDFSHPDFQDSLGKTRVKWLWDMSKAHAANTPLPYNYGQEWDNKGIDSGAAVSHTDVLNFGHGTYVAGIGAGNGRAVGRFAGVATNADIIMVAFDFTYTGTTPRTADAVKYIISKADSMHKPCVINASLGSDYGSHDGLDLEAKLIKNLITSHPGIIMVAAAGNAGHLPFHLGHDVHAGDTTFTWFKYDPAYGLTYIQVFADTAQFRNVRFAIGVDRPTPDYSFLGMTGFASITSRMGLHTDSIYNGSNRIGIIQSFGSLESPGVYSLEYNVLPDSANYYWRFITTGTGHLDSWSHGYVYANLPTAAVFPDIVHYSYTDSLSTMVSSFTCLDSVITVGNYYNTDRHMDVDSVIDISPNDRPDDLAENSGRGPTRDGRLKPDIAATGHHIISTGVLSTIPTLISSGQSYKVAPGGFHVTGGGTSASAPVVAGIAALYLQMKPTASISEFRYALTTCGKHDQFTWGPTPNNAWGFGKADAYHTLLCTFTGTNETYPDLIRATIYPNPFTSFTTVSLDKDFTGSFECRMTDALGKEVMRKNFAGNLFIIERKDLKAGVYFFEICSLENNKEFKGRGKVVVED